MRRHTINVTQIIGMCPIIRFEHNIVLKSNMAILVADAAAQANSASLCSLQYYAAVTVVGLIFSFFLILLPNFLRHFLTDLSEILDGGLVTNETIKTFSVIVFVVFLY